MKNFKARGDVVTITASGTVSSGDAVAIGDRAGIACHDAVNGESLQVLIEGVVSYAKTNVAMAIGEKLYFDAGDDDVQKDDDSGTNKAIGWAASAAASGDTTVDVKLGAF